MCVGVPVKVEKVKKSNAVVSSVLHPQHFHKVDLSYLTEKIKKGDYLLVHHNIALSKVPSAEAKKILEMIKSLPHK